MLPNLRFGNYTVSGMLGPGGVTETYLAHRSDEAEHLYALKLLRPDRLEPDQLTHAVQRFSHAGRQLLGLVRPGLCPVFEVSDDANQCYLVSDYILGHDLNRLLALRVGEARPDRPGLDPLLVSLIGAEAARILHSLHVSKPSLAHLNLCPGNIIVAKTGELKLLDAGIAASLRGYALQPIECWQDVAPEILGKDLVAEPLSDRSAIAADLYSLGAVMYRMLMGKPQGNGDSLESLRKQKHQSWTGAPHLPPNLIAALRALLAPDAEDRPPSAAAVVEWLAADVPTSTMRQHYIAQGIALVEKGTPALSQEIPVQADVSPLPTTVSKTSRISEASLRSVVVTGRGGARKRRIFWGGVVMVGLLGILVFALVFLPKKSVILNPVVKTPVTDPETIRSIKRQPSNESEAEENEKDTKRIPRVTGHLVVDTVPPGATVWVDGKKRGKTFVDLMIGEGGHRILVIAPGHKIFREVVDTTNGVIIRRRLHAVEPPTKGDGFLTVECKTEGEYPILLDDEETGLLCPTKSIPAITGKHLVGIFLPSERKTISMEVTVVSGDQHTLAKFSE